MKIGMCVVGCGEFARIFAKSIQPMLSDIDLYFASRDLAKARRYSFDFNGAGAFGSYEDAVKNPDIQAVYICTPHYLHLKHSCLAASYGKHILVEKPISCSVDQAEQLIISARKAKVNLMVAENYRFMPDIQLCKKLADEGQIGQIRMVHIQEESQHQLKGWRKNAMKNGGGVFIDAGIHKVHFLRFLLGEPSRLYALQIGAGDVNQSVEDSLIFMSKWAAGEFGLIHHSSTPLNNRSSHSITLTGTTGTMFLNIRESTLRIYSKRNQKIIRIPRPSNGLLPMAQEFIASIRENRDPEVTGEEGLKDLILVVKAYESIINQTSVSLLQDYQGLQPAVS